MFVSLIPFVKLTRSFDAAVLIDMQENYLERMRTVHAPRNNISVKQVNTSIDDLLFAQKEVLVHCATNKKPVYIIEQKGMGKTVDELLDYTPNIAGLYVKSTDKKQAWKSDLLHSLDNKNITTLVTMGMHLDQCVREVNKLLTQSEVGYKVLSAQTLVDNPAVFKVSSYEQADLHRITYLDSHKELAL